VVFGITMFALVGSSVLSVAQVGFTVGAGLLVDTLIVRTFVMPSLVALLGRWFWWPAGVNMWRDHTRPRGDTPSGVER
jgi:RND superfamily putative drug exporter